MNEQAQTERELRAARNQTLFREVNERLQGIAEAFQFVAEHASFACECADVGCVAQIEMTVDEYEAIRASPTHFAVLPGHVYPDVESIVRTTDRYVVVAKIAAGAELAKQADPRRAAAR